MSLELHIASHTFTNSFVKLAGPDWWEMQGFWKAVSQASQGGQAAKVFFFSTEFFLFYP